MLNNCLKKEGKNIFVDKVIQAQLRSIEEKNNVKILYAVESGSRGWGFESKDSNFDVRFIYVHPIKWYLSVFEGADIIEIPVDEVLDVNGWDLRKALKLMYKSNSCILNEFFHKTLRDFSGGINE
ncbi:DNA polymerase beta superfamily protein [Clostridium weizhouense]|uniref:DNA polymerase beta superfamily protein n=1 Tax=Clostridium weizhouense TaxID=2859781 RepID=UPI0027E5612B|nr:nucleotidyltransferase domain-containing protein [Clostridium weizhouense]